MLQPGETAFDCLYDFGDSWEHKLTVTGIRRGEPGVAYLATGGRAIAGSSGLGLLLDPTRLSV